MRWLVRFITVKDTANFRFAELDAALEMAGIVDAYDEKHESPYLIVRLPAEEIAQFLCQQTILIREIFALEGDGVSHEACLATIKPASTKRSWRLDIEVYGEASTRTDELRDEYAAALDLRGPVKLTSPEDSYRVMCYRHVFCGRLVAVGDNKRRYDLKKRVFLGPTALDNQLAFLMATIARVRGGVVLDPYCGTGSILVACAAKGAFCFGADIDWKVLRGKAAKENDGAVTRRHTPVTPSVFEQTRKTVFSNFRQYSLPLPEILRLDASRFFDHFNGFDDFFDAIVTDPPYGIRAGARCGGSRPQDSIRKVPADLREEHVPRTKPYPVVDVLADLLEIAARVLKLHGVLAYLLPATNDFDPHKHLPQHPALLLLDCCEQELGSRYSRYLVVMRKARLWSKDDCDPDTRKRICEMADAPYAALKEKVFAPASSRL